MMIFQSAKKRALEGEAGLEGIPGWMKDQTIHFTRGDLGTDILTVPGMMGGEIGELLDLAGDPVGHFKEASRQNFRNITRQITPVGQAVAEIFTGSASKKWSSRMRELPNEFQKLPDKALTGLGAKAEVNNQGQQHKSILLVYAEKP